MTANYSGRKSACCSDHQQRQLRPVIPPTTSQPSVSARLTRYEGHIQRSTAGHSDAPRRTAQPFLTSNQQRNHRNHCRSPKCCSLDPLPTWIIKKLKHVFAPILCSLCNSSLSNGVMPASQKHAIVLPRLKKPCFPVFTKLSIEPTPLPPPTLHSFRRLHSIDTDSFLDDLTSSPLMTNPPESLDSLLVAYNTTLSSLLDEHAPVITKLIEETVAKARVVETRS